MHWTVLMMICFLFTVSVVDHNKIIINNFVTICILSLSCELRHCCCKYAVSPSPPNCLPSATNTITTYLLPYIIVNRVPLKLNCSSASSSSSSSSSLASAIFLCRFNSVQRYLIDNYYYYYIKHILKSEACAPPASITSSWRRPRPLYSDCCCCCCRPRCGTCTRTR